MRLADAITLFRTALVIAVAYMIMQMMHPYLIVALIAFAMLLDGVDGYAALWQESKGEVSFVEYLRATAGNPLLAERIKRFKERIQQHSPHGPRMDVAGDRVAEYVFWILFTYLNIIPIFVLFIIVIRHSFADALMGARGTSSKMKTGFARAVYSSNISRGGVNVAKFLTFSYLSLVYTLGYPIIIGYVLAGILVTIVLARGAAEIYESVA